MPPFLCSVPLEHHELINSVNNVPEFLACSVPLEHHELINSVNNVPEFLVRRTKTETYL
ncbi:hypothetical protein D1BOALGB6SA_9074 [Olavius sp. associated proteobacterium Delta 1]|nr:hypothetical protein D1BOALGB6SA_9074 [Olavius sp. associated proteobacterium Delta 1]